MNTFRKYEKIYRLGKDEVLGILDVPVYVQEKIDGANLSCWWENDWVHVGSRSNDLTKNGNEFNGAVHYINAHKGITEFFSIPENQKCTLYGEWLVRHTIAYKETAYRKFYMYDIYDNEKEEYLDQPSVQAIAEQYSIEYVPILGTFPYADEAAIKALVGKTHFGDRGEGVVIKPKTPYKNQFGDNVYAKVVTESFKEDNAVVFGGNNKFSDTYWEIYVVNKYITLPRVEKIMHKLQPEVNEKLDMKHIPRIMGMVYHDMITEEGWDIAKDVPKIDYQVLKRIADKKSKQVYVDILDGNISVADQ